MTALGRYFKIEYLRLKHNRRSSSLASDHLALVADVALSQGSVWEQAGYLLTALSFAAGMWFAINLLLA